MEEGDKPEAVAQASALGPEASPAAPAAPSAAAPDQHRREALRKAGADYLEKALAQSRRNPADHFAPVDAPLAPSASVPRPSPTASSRGRRGKQPQALDPDVAAFGQVFESTKLYVYMGLYLACQGAIYVLIKGSLTTMKTPGLMSFLHLSSASLSFWLSSTYDVFDTRAVLEAPLRCLRGISVRATLYGLQMLLLYSSLLHSSVYMILSWAASVPLLIDAGLSLVTGKRSRLLAPHIVPLVAAAAGATVLEVVLDGTLSWLSLVMLLLWSATKAAETLWRLLKEDPSLGGRLPGGDFGSLAGAVRSVAEAEEGLNAPAVALLVNAVPALPVLVAGFIGQEGREIVDHELSVPAVKLMLLSCVAHVGITWSQLLLHDRLSGTAKAALRWGALLGAVAFNFAEKTAGATLWTALCAVVALGASAGASLQRHTGSEARQMRPFDGLAVGGGGGGGGGAIDDDDDKDPESG
ncbi:hypothetical protein CHLRE_02g076500v5 [Chlamydomonas reinhardtii]|uniref:Sugar phosphate transporter domain-containing protein n=1 Tax=Chlamydomonas reinhardtii TaxID=3055 RepID=A8IA54_CHLRE|nr:uncharacterized protein CHLRE_02g076500v5 [Chlamydomonas reinhardtii]PNW86191.1 hypothetical protein CHLRE_02g076500v5 [Chlamydomonas reinhardtii]|eukprot:XP_001701848.1 predicted protein [Chlamydomonas reinhardtii]